MHKSDAHTIKPHIFIFTHNNLAHTHMLHASFCRFMFPDKGTNSLACIAHTHCPCAVPSTYKFATLIELIRFKVNIINEENATTTKNYKIYI